jgi:hypothetical protein
MVRQGERGGYRQQIPPGQKRRNERRLIVLTAVHTRCARLLAEFVDTRRGTERREFLAQLVDDARASMNLPPLCGPVVASEGIVAVKEKAT